MEGWDYRWLQRQVGQYFSPTSNIECHDMEFGRLYDLGLNILSFVSPFKEKFRWFTGSLFKFFSGGTDTAYTQCEAERYGPFNMIRVTKSMQEILMSVCRLHI